MRVGLLVVAGLALLGFLVVAVLLPQLAGSEAKAAAQALVGGAQPAQQQVGANVQQSGNLAGAGKGVKIAAKTDPRHGELKWLVARTARSAAGTRKIRSKWRSPRACRPAR